MSRRSAPHPAALAALASALALAGPVAGCREERPLSAAIADRLIAAAESPRPSHVTSTSQLTLTLPLPGQPLDLQVAMDAEQWTRDAAHVRTETTSRLALAGAGSGAGESPAGAMVTGILDALGGELRTTTVRSGTVVATHESLLNTFATLDLEQLPEGAERASRAEAADHVRTAIRDIAAGYLLNPLGDREVAGRPAFALAIVPRNADAPRPVLDVLRVQNGQIVVDKETYDVLAFEGEGQIVRAAGPRLGDDGSSLAALRRALEGAAAARPIPAAYRMTVASYEPDPDLPDALFALVPPEGATQIDVLALATSAAATATALAVGGAGEDAPDAPPPTPAAASAPPASAEATLAALALGELAPGAAFAVLAPAYVPSGCAVTESGRLPAATGAAEPPRMIWVSLICPDGALRLEQKAAGDTALSFDEDEAERLTAMVAGERVPYFRREGGGGAVLVPDAGGTSVKVSGTLDVAMLVRVAESMR